MKSLVIFLIFVLASVEAMEIQLGDEDVAAAIRAMDKLHGNQTQILSSKTGKFQILKELATKLVELVDDYENNKETDALAGFHIVLLKADGLQENQSFPCMHHVEKTFKEEQIKKILSKEVIAVEIVGVTDGSNIKAVAAFLVKNKFMRVLCGANGDVQLSVEALFLACKVVLEGQVLRTIMPNPYALGVTFFQTKTSGTHTYNESIMKWIVLRQQDKQKLESSLKSPRIRKEGESAVDYNSFGFGFMENTVGHNIVVFFDTAKYGYKVGDFWEAKIVQPGKPQEVDPEATVITDMKLKPNATLKKAASLPSMNVKGDVTDGNTVPIANSNIFQKTAPGPPLVEERTITATRSNKLVTASAITNTQTRPIVLLSTLQPTETIRMRQTQISTNNLAPSNNVHANIQRQTSIKTAPSASQSLEFEKTSKPVSQTPDNKGTLRLGNTRSQVQRSASAPCGLVFTKDWTTKSDLEAVILAEVNVFRGKGNQAVKVETKANEAAKIILINEKKPYEEVNIHTQESIKYLVKKFKINKVSNLSAAVKDALNTLTAFPGFKTSLKHCSDIIGIDAKIEVQSASFAIAVPEIINN